MMVGKTYQQMIRYCIYFQSSALYLLIQKLRKELQIIKMLKKEQADFFQTEIKNLHRKFKILDRGSIKILLEFCQFDIDKTHRIMTVATDLKNPNAIIEYLLKRPEKSEEYLNQLQTRFYKEYGGTVEQETVEMEIQKHKIVYKCLEYEFFKEIPADCIVHIMSFLDPYAFLSFSFTNSINFKLSKSEAQASYYKKICTKLYTMEEPNLPGFCRFQKIRDYVLQRPLQFGPNTRNAVNQNLRYYVWKNDTASFKLSSNYYKTFGSYENLFKSCPKINLNGFYICKHKYVKTGEKDLKNFITPIHIIYYYRYLRFFEDGSVLYYVCNRKLKKEKIMEALTSRHLEEQYNNENQQKQMEPLIGEYMQYKDQVYVKAAKENEVFGYEFSIRSTNNLINNELVVMTYVLELVDEAEIVQTLYQQHPNKQSLFFSYQRFDSIREENSDHVKACSL